ncbi:hypothetical protein JYU34_006002 [Plutella xylostella]|uniref:FP protein C-terminal domain-containing protein n=1 Tax=Plutella xylostella TaxID=51655 RepID=A0ABQ7QUP2_PLUXY|nr:hypothetical protein JYU34_006002 [Plutella xylostella]
MGDNSIERKLVDLICSKQDAFMGQVKTEIMSFIKEEIPKLIRGSFAPEFESLKKKLEGLETSMTFIGEQYEDFKKSFETQTEEMKLLKNENEYLKKKMTGMEARLSDMEQQSRQNNIELNGIPEHKQEVPSNIVKQLGKVISFNIGENEIASCSRVAKINKDSKAPRSIVCQFPTKLYRDNFLAAAIKYNKANPDKKLSSTLLGIGGKDAAVFVAEHLTPSNKSLHAEARITARNKGYKFVWVRNGKILVRKNEGSPAIVISKPETLKLLS